VSHVFSDLEEVTVTDIWLGPLPQLHDVRHAADTAARRPLSTIRTVCGAGGNARRNDCGPG